MKATVRLVLLTALRDRLFSGLLGLIATTLGVALFLGNATLIEQAETGAVYAAGAVRVVLILGLVVFIAFQCQRLYESREIEAILSRSMSRSAFVIAYWSGCAVVAAVLVGPVAAVIFALYGLSTAAAVWAASLYLECLVVTSFTLFAALTLERATTTIFVALAFYAFTRLIGFFLGIREVATDFGANRIINPIIDTLGLVLPRLDLMAQTTWLVYGFESQGRVEQILAQSVVAVALFLAAAAFDLNRKQF